MLGLIKEVTEMTGVWFRTNINVNVGFQMNMSQVPLQSPFCE